MSCYIASGENRFYAALEADYGVASAVSEVSRIPAIQLRVRQEVERPRRIDKTGHRTFPGLPGGFRKSTTFELATLLTGWGGTGAPACDALFQAALGASPLAFEGGTLAPPLDESVLVFSAPHGLAADQAVVVADELRFVATVMDEHTVGLSVPLTRPPEAGSPVGRTVTYLPANRLPSLTIFDYWDPGDSVHRLLPGAGLDRMLLRVNGDLHHFAFTGVAGDVIDSASFQQGEAGMSVFPEEPPAAGYQYSVVPGNLGQAWFGALPHQFFSVLEAEIELDNNLEMRNREFGSSAPKCLVPGLRRVSADFRLYANTNPETRDLYMAARQGSPVSMMLQLGQQQGHLCGAYLKAVVPEVPEFDDEENRLQWRFRNCRAQGSLNDEIVLAFG